MIPTTISPPPPSPGIRARMPAIGRILWFVLDFAIPLGIFYLLIGQGTSLYIALLASALYSIASGTVSWLRGERNEVALVMFLLTIASGAIAFVSGSDRFLLARESVLTAMMGGWFLASLRGERPLTYRFTKPLLEGRFRTKPIWDYLWDHDAGFRRIWRVTTIMWGIALLIDAALRVVLAYSMPVKAVPALQTGMMLATVAIMQVIVNLYYIAAGLWPRLHGYGPHGMPDHPDAGRAGTPPRPKGVVS
ncbi:MAG: VC0807 family protein [Thermomicrobiales bacterium]